MKKKFVSLLLALSLSGTAAVFADNNTTPAAGTAGQQTVKSFDDIKGESYAWAYSYINDMVKRGYIEGYEDNTFRPDSSVTRLEVLALFARAMGVNEKINAPVADLALEQYEDKLDVYKLPWGAKEIAFLMYRDVLNETDLATYLQGELKNQPMPRHEAAVIITKAMGGVAEATKDPGVILDYKDQKDIPSASLQYVAYVTEKGIMNGMEDNTFLPNSSVKRSQMAVMLSRVVDKTDYTFEKVILTEVDTAGRILSVETAAGEEQRMTYLDSAVLKASGEKVLIKDAPIGSEAIITCTDEKAVFIDTFAKITEDAFYATFQSLSSSASGTGVLLQREDTGERRTYGCSDTMSVIFDGTPANLSVLKKGYRVYAELSGGKLERLTGETKTVTITGAQITEITNTPALTITISHADAKYDGKTYEIGEDVAITKGGEKADFSSIYTGDKVTLTTEYGVVTRIQASSTKKTVEGTITSISKSMYDRPKMVIRVNGEDQEYEIPDSIKVTVSGQAATIDDLNLGDVVKLTLSSNAITEIVKTASVTTETGPISGMVTSIVTANKFIVIEYTTSGGVTSSIPVVVRDTTNIMTTKGIKKAMKDLKIGHAVSVYGETGSNGAYTANMIIVDEAASRVVTDK